MLREVKNKSPSDLNHDKTCVHYLGFREKDKALEE